MFSVNHTDDVELQNIGECYGYLEMLVAEIPNKVCCGLPVE